MTDAERQVIVREGLRERLIHTPYGDLLTFSRLLGEALDAHMRQNNVLARSLIFEMVDAIFPATAKAKVDDE